MSIILILKMFIKALQSPTPWLYHASPSPIDKSKSLTDRAQECGVFTFILAREEWYNADT